MRDLSIHHLQAMLPMLARLGRFDEVDQAWFYQIVMDMEKMLADRELLVAARHAKHAECQRKHTMGEQLKGLMEKSVASCES